MSREGNPSGESEAGLAGDLGISSEREGELDGIDGTGTSASAQGRTDGDSTMHPEDTGQAHEGDPAATQSRHGVPGSEEESNPAEVPAQKMDPDRHPRHSHGA